MEPRPNSQYPQTYQVQSLKDYRGRQVYLEFWDSACSTCLKQLQNMAAMNANEPKDQIALLSISVDKNPRDALKVMQKLGLNFPVLSDPSGYVAQKYGVSVVPTAFLISERGLVKKVVLGFSSISPIPLTFSVVNERSAIDASING